MQLTLVDAEAIFDLRRAQSGKRRGEPRRVEGFSRESQRARAFARTAMQIDERRLYPEKSADPMRDVVNREFAESLILADRHVSGPMQRFEIRRGADRLIGALQSAFGGVEVRR